MLINFLNYDRITRLGYVLDVRGPHVVMFKGMKCWRMDHRDRECEIRQAIDLALQMESL